MAILRGDSLVFFRNRIADGEAGLADMVHQTAMYYEDRLERAGFSRVVLAGGGSPASARRPGRRLPAPRARAAARHQSRRRRSAERRDLDGSHYRQQRAAGRARAARRPAGARAGGLTMLRTNLSTRPFYNERGVHGVLGVTALIVVALTIFNLTQIVLLTRRQSSLSSQAAAAETRAARAARARGADTAGRRRQAARSHLRRRARSERHHRPAAVLVDRSAEPPRDHAARQRAHHVAAAERRARRRHHGAR